MRTKPFDFFSALLRDGEGGGAGGGSDKPAGDAKPAASGGTIAEIAAREAPAAATPYVPEGLPDTFKGASDKETIDKLFGDINGRPKPPEKPDGYKFEFAEDFTKKYGDLKDDKVVGVWAEVAHELGLDNAQANGALTKLYERLDASGMLDLGPDPDAEISALMPKTGDDATRRAEALKRINNAGAWVKGLEAKGLSKDGVTSFSEMLTTAKGVEALEFLQRTFNQPGLNGGGQGGAQDGGQTAAEKADRAMYPSHFKTA